MLVEKDTKEILQRAHGVIGSLFEKGFDKTLQDNIIEAPVKTPAMDAPTVEEVPIVEEVVAPVVDVEVAPVYEEEKQRKIKELQDKFNSPKSFN